MTGYQSKKAAAQDKLTQPAQEPVHEALKLALEALEYRGASTWLKHGIAVEAIKAELAQLAQEPSKKKNT